ncbi:PhzF family phenazine biosynthesis protein [Ktedonobacter robiniae]|uniref:Phenazine biosynthesis protein PhzF n=1 Tax=Ktedonobacter robiniae TaxID=2778365 RepID=A0ABQ3UXD0_9CHLR|nr:PhzF family phenazine biosynthesis protein [Ktedonobacter robiniae]GHO57506.1 phenazine biosynthesis protein PhzF [Ktedonobacter robiniae]
MSTYHYYLVDVFADRAFGGNPLAVFTDARGLSSETMQAVAKELNLSETAFVLPPQKPENDFQLRIFTPAVELPMAGHPTVGTAFMLARKGLVQINAPTTNLIFEEGVGEIAMTLHMLANQSLAIQMHQPLPSFGERFADRAAIAELLSLSLEDIDAALPLEVVSCGVPFLFVPITSLAAMRAIQFRRDVWERVLRDFATPHVFAFTQEVETPGATIHSRMFAPAMGIAEDPATGAASGPLGCYLVRHKLVESAASVEIVSEQGLEMGRPSFLQITIDSTGDEITGVSIGGQCHFMGEGALEF